MSIQVDQQRLAEVFRLKIAGLDDEEIAYELTNRGMARYPASESQVKRDIGAINRIMNEYGDAESARTAIALDIDRLFAMILEDLNTTYNWDSRPAARAEFYKQGAQLLMQKALLFGLNSETMNINRNAKLQVLVQQLRQLDASQLEPETGYLQGDQSEPLPAPRATLAGLLVESDTGDGR